MRSRIMCRAMRRRMVSGLYSRRSRPERLRISNKIFWNDCSSSGAAAPSSSARTPGRVNWCARRRPAGGRHFHITDVADRCMRGCMIPAPRPWAVLRFLFAAACNAGGFLRALCHLHCKAFAPLSRIPPMGCHRTAFPSKERAIWRQLRRYTRASSASR